MVVVVGYRIRFLLSQVGFRCFKSLFAHAAPSRRFAHSNTLPNNGMRTTLLASGPVRGLTCALIKARISSRSEARQGAAMRSMWQGAVSFGRAMTPSEVYSATEHK